jgi:hypothetical protein
MAANADAAARVTVLGKEWKDPQADVDESSFRSSVSDLVEQLGKYSAALLPPLEPDSSSGFDIKSDQLHFSHMKWEQVTNFAGVEWPLHQCGRDSTVLDTFFDENVSAAVKVPTGARISLPPGIVGTNNRNSANVTAAIALYSRNASFSLFPSNMTIASSIISVQLPGLVEHGELMPANITLTFDLVDDASTTSDVNNGAFECVWWDATNVIWNTSGCSGEWVEFEANSATWGTDAPTASTTFQCSCNHLTHFGVLFRQGNPELPTVHDRVLTVFGYVGIAISLVFLAATFTTYAVFSHLRETPQLILMHLTVAIAISQIMFLCINRSKSSDASSAVDNAADERTTLAVSASCKATAILLHYSLISTWTWMVIEGYYMRERLVLVFHSLFPIKQWTVIGWCLPAAIVAISVGVWFDDYGTGEICWIEPNSGAMYMFLVPCFVGLAINIGILASVMWAIRNDVHTDEARSTRTMLKAGATFSTTLGLQYVFGALIVADGSTVWDYLFSITLMTQGGLIYWIHCFSQPGVRFAMMRRSRLTLAQSKLASGPKRGARQSRPGFVMNAMNNAVPVRPGANGGSDGDVALNPKLTAVSRAFTDFGEDEPRSALSDEGSGGMLPRKYTDFGDSLNSDMVSNMVHSVGSVAEEEMLSPYMFAQPPPSTPPPSSVAERRVTNYSETQIVTSASYSFDRPTPTYVPVPGYHAPPNPPDLVEMCEELVAPEKERSLSTYSVQSNVKHFSEAPLVEIFQRAQKEPVRPPRRNSASEILNDLQRRNSAPIEGGRLRGRRSSEV